MVPRRERLSRAALTEGLTSGTRRSSAHFSIVFPETGRGYAVIISKKTARLSATRHRIKRRVLAALRNISSSRAAIVFPRAEVARMEYDAITTELQKLLS